MKEKTIPALRIEIRPSKLIAGEVGLFTVRAIKKDEIVAPATSYEETAFPWSVYKKLDKLTKKKIDDFCSATEDFFYAPPDFNYLQINWFMNHSCDPNVGFNSRGDFVAMHNIKKDTELVWDYSYNESNPRFKMKCNCKTNACRKIITGNDWKFLAKDKNIYPYLSKSIQQLHKKR